MKLTSLKRKPSRRLRKNFVARGKVVSVSSNSHMSGGDERSMSVQITDMAWGKP